MVFHHLKPVINNGMVVKTHVSAEAAQTNLCWHHHFAPKNLSDNEIVHHIGAQTGEIDEPPKAATDITALRLTIMKLVKTTPSQIMSISGLTKSVYPDGDERSDPRSIRHLRRHIQLLAEKGYIKRVHIQDTEGNMHRHFLQFLRDYDPSLSDTYGEVDLDEDVSDIDDNLSGDEELEAGEFVQVNLLRTLPLERQFLDYIQQADVDGTTTMALHEHFNGLGTRTSDPIFHIMENEMPPTCKHLEFFVMRDVVGKEHVNKYYNISVADEVGADSKTLAQAKKKVSSKVQKSLVAGEFTIIHENLLPPSQTFQDQLVPRPIVKKKPKAAPKVKVATIQDAEPGTAESNKLGSDEAAPDKGKSSNEEPGMAVPDNAESDATGVDDETSEFKFQTMAMRTGSLGRPRKHPHLYYPDGIYVRSPEGRRRFKQEKAEGICTLPPQPNNAHPLNYHTERPGLKRGRPKKKSRKKGVKKAVNDLEITRESSSVDQGTNNTATAAIDPEVKEVNVGESSRKRSRSLDSKASAVTLEPPAKKVQQDLSVVDGAATPDSLNLATIEPGATTAEIVTPLTTPKRRGRPPKHLKIPQSSSVISEMSASTDSMAKASVLVTPTRRGRPPKYPRPDIVLPTRAIQTVENTSQTGHSDNSRIPEPSSLVKPLPQAQPAENNSEDILQRPGFSRAESPQHKRGRSPIWDITEESANAEQEKSPLPDDDADATMSDQTPAMSDGDARPVSFDASATHDELFELPQGLVKSTTIPISHALPMESLDEPKSIPIQNAVESPTMQVDATRSIKNPSMPTVSTNSEEGPLQMEIDPPDTVHQPSTPPPAVPKPPAEVSIKQKSTSPDLLDPSLEPLQPKERLASESPMKPVNKASVAKRNITIMDVLTGNGDIMDAADLMQAVQKIYDEAADQEGRPRQMIDKKTFSRSFHALEQEDKLTVRILPFVGRAGRTIQKTFIVKSNLDLNGEFVKKFIVDRAKKTQAESLHSRKLPVVPVLQNVQLEIIESPRETPHSDLAGTATLVARPPPQPRRKFGSNPDLLKMLQISQQYGWRYGIFPRIKLLHQHLLGNGLDGPKMFRGIDLVFGLPVEKYLRLFQLHIPQLGLATYLKSMDFDMHTKVIDLEEKPRALLLSSPATRDRHLRDMVQEMQHLGLIKVLGVDQYELQVETDLNKPFGLEPLIRSVRTPEEVAVYWSNLQVRALEKEDEQGNDPVNDIPAGSTEEKKPLARIDSVRMKPILLRPQQWSTAWHLSAGQANFLRALIKNGDPDTPIKDEVRLNEIVEKTGLPKQDIVDFYQPIQDGFDKARLAKEKQLAKSRDKIAAAKARIAMKRREAEERGLVGPQSGYTSAIRQRMRAGLTAFRTIAPAPAAIAPQPGQYSMPTQSFNNSQTFRPIPPANNLPSPSIWPPSSPAQSSDGNHLPRTPPVVSEETRRAIWRLVEHAIPEDPHMAARRRSLAPRASTIPGTSKWRSSQQPIAGWSSWTPAKDETLLKAYAIARHIGSGEDVTSLFRSIAKVFGNTEGPDACARRLKYLCEGKQDHSNKYAGLLEEYMQIWSAIYEDAVDRGVLPAQDELTDTFEVDDWISCIAIVQQVIRQVEREPRDLFSNVEEIERQLNFKPKDHIVRHDQAAKGSDIQRKSGYLQCLISKKMNDDPFIVRLKSKPKVDFDKAMVRGAVFAVLSTEEEKFEEEKADSLLQRYDEILLKATTSSLLAEGIISRTSGAFPGRNYRFSER